MENSKQHWENIYSTKPPNELSWTQEYPKTSIEFIRSAKLHKSAAIIDIGGGDSKLVDFLIEDGYKNITVLDISEQAILRAQKRLGKNADRINWVISNITDFEPTIEYDYWHDRAAFHFLTTNSQIQTYIALAGKSIKKSGLLTIGTFSKEGPKKCSGLEIKQYSEQLLEEELSNGFIKMNCRTENHTTPFNTIQNFLFCNFRRNEASQ